MLPRSPAKLTQEKESILFICVQSVPAKWSSGIPPPRELLLQITTVIVKFTLFNLCTVFLKNNVTWTKKQQILVKIYSNDAEEYKENSVSFSLRAYP